MIQKRPNIQNICRIHVFWGGFSHEVNFVLLIANFFFVKIVRFAQTFLSLFSYTMWLSPLNISG